MKKIFYKLLLKLQLSKILLSLFLIFIIMDITKYSFYKIYNNKYNDNNITKNYQIIKEIKQSNEIYLKYNYNNYSSDIILHNKNNKFILFKDIPLISISSNYEKIFIDNNISFSWIKDFKEIKNLPKEFIDNNNNNHLLILEKKEQIINLLFFIFIIFILEKSGIINIGLNNKFKLYFPEDIKGDINDLIGLDEIKEEIQKLKKTIYSKNNIYFNFNILFSGNPGLGKTKMALYLAKELNIPILVGTGNVETGFVGGGASNIKNLFAKSNMIASLFEKKCIIFLDEAQILFKKRNNLNGNKWEDDSTNELLSYLDGVNTKNQNKIIFIAASNFDENNMNFDSAIERRFQKKIYFRNPNKKEREEIFKFYLEQNKINIQNIDINYLSEITSNLSPGKIEIIVKETLIYKNFEIEKITTEDLIKNFEILTVGHTTKEITKEKEEERELIIKHELGHFFCYYQLLSQKYNYDKKKIIENLKILKISSESIARQNALGYVLNVQKDINLKSLNELEEEIICLYGGVASEEVFYGKDKITVGSFNDIEKITEILNTIVNKLNMYSNYKINYNNLLKEQQKDNLIVIEKKSELLFNKSKEIIQQNKNKIEKLSIILKENWIIDKNQIIDLINKGTI